MFAASTTQNIVLVLYIHFFFKRTYKIGNPNFFMTPGVPEWNKFINISAESRMDPTGF